MFFGRNQKKERPFCTHCGYSGHTIEKCYKLHGYLSGYKPKQRNSSFGQANSITVNQVYEVPNQPKNHENFGSFMQTLIPVQYQQLMGMLSSHLLDAKTGLDADASLD